MRPLAQVRIARGSSVCSISSEYPLAFGEYANYSRTFRKCWGVRTRRLRLGKGDGVPHLGFLELDDVLLQLGELCCVWEFIHACSGRVLVGAFKVVADDGGCVRPGNEGGFACAV